MCHGDGEECSPTLCGLSHNTTSVKVGGFGVLTYNLTADEIGYVLARGLEEVAAFHVFHLDLIDNVGVVDFFRHVQCFFA